MPFSHLNHFKCVYAKNHIIYIIKYNLISSIIMQSSVPVADYRMIIIMMQTIVYPVFYILCLIYKIEYLKMQTDTMNICMYVHDNNNNDSTKK